MLGALVSRHPLTKPPGAVANEVPAPAQAKGVARRGTGAERLPAPEGPRFDCAPHSHDGRVGSVLDLQPRPRRVGSITVLRLFGHDALKPHSAGVLEDFSAIAVHVINELNAVIMRAQQILQPPLALQERQFAHISSINLQDGLTYPCLRFLRDLGYYRCGPATEPRGS
jgi:hypothetical protein